MASWVIILILIAYLGLLFGLGIWASKRAKSKWVNNGWVYALSLAVYCSAWTYYGSVGVAASTGPEFLTTYLGPIIALPLWIIITRRVFLLSKEHKVTSIADFISLRYGKNRSLGAIVTILCLVAVLPYISLQLKAIAETFDILTKDTAGDFILTDSTFYIALLLAAFVALFGTQLTDAARTRSGLIFTVAVESVLKLTFFLLIGGYAVFYLFNGTGDLLTQAQNLPDYQGLTQLDSLAAGINWYFMIALSFFAIFLLPRQFHVSVVENTKVSHLKKASWIFPLYLLLFNIFVIFIAYAGRIILGDSINADYYTLYLPLSQGHNWLAILVFMGGLSSIISMVVISTLALSVMLSNNLIIPYGLLKRFSNKESRENARNIRNIRRASVFILITGAYFFYRNFNVDVSLFSIGQVAFVIIAQLAPAFFIGLFWNRGSAFGAKIGILAGSLVTVYTLIVPFVFDAFGIDSAFAKAGPASIALLKPYALFGIDFLSPISHAFFWSMLFNMMGYLVFSLSRKGDYRERNYAEMVVNASQYAALDENAYVWRGEAYVSKIREVLVRFLGEKRTARALDIFYRKYNLDPSCQMADARLINFSEKLLTGTLGAASAKITISSVVKEQPVSLVEVLNVLEETKETKKANKQLQQLSDQLSVANEELVEQDRQKDEFLDTVAHELKTPAASIRAACEVLADAEDMPPQLRRQFLDNIVSDTERLSKLINNILDLEKLSSGREELNLQIHSLPVTIHKAMDGVYQLAQKKGAKIKVENWPEVSLEYDEDRILQVFTNLLSNSLKFVPENNGVIKIDGTVTDEEVIMAFEDNGRGVPQEDAPYIFEKFYQARGQNIKKPEGSGMGLAISKHIIERHGGEIELDKNFKGGARFLLKLKR